MSSNTIRRKEGVPEDDSPKSIGENPLASRTAHERVDIDGVLRARGINHSPDVKEDFPKSLHKIVLALRRMPHDEYIRLVDVCKDNHPANQLLGKTPSSALEDLAIEVVKLGGFQKKNVEHDPIRHDILRLSRTERPDDGSSTLEKDTEKSSYGAANILKATLIMSSGRLHEFTVEPTDSNTSKVTVTGGGFREIKGGETLILGSHELKLKKAFGVPFINERKVRCDLVIGGEGVDRDPSMSRSCIKVTRTKDGQVDILECGTTNVENVVVNESALNGDLVASVTYNPKSGASMVQRGSATQKD